MKKQHNWKRALMGMLAVILIAIGGLLIFNAPVTSWLVKQNQKASLAKVLQQKKPAATASGMFDFNKVKSMTATRALKARVHNTSHAIGAVAIPVVHLALPILVGLSDDSLSTGGGTMRANQVMGQGNYPLAGHYMTTKGILFSPIAQVQKGDLVYLTNLKRVYRYRVYRKEIVNPTALYLVRNTKKAIVTLITCADGGIKRWAIRGRLTKTQPATEAALQVFKLK